MRICVCVCTLTHWKATEKDHQTMEVLNFPPLVGIKWGKTLEDQSVSRRVEERLHDEGVKMSKDIRLPLRRTYVCT